MMKSISAWWATHRPTKRRIVQLYSALLFNAHLRGFAEGKLFTGATKTICVPGLNCYSCPGAMGACPLGSIQNALGSLNKRVGFYVLGIVLLYGVLLGRTVCGWLCPVGLIQELLCKVPTFKVRKSRVTRALSYLKYVLLAIFVVAVPVYFGLVQGMQVPAFCKFICPAGTLEGAMGLLPHNAAWLSMLGQLFTNKLVIMILVGLACVFCYRAFCRFICPLGAILGMFNRLAVIGVKVDGARCNGCGACVRRCKMDVRFVGDHECIHCGRCVKGCAQGAISMQAEGLVAKGAVKVGMVVLLAFALVWGNYLDSSLHDDGPKTVDAPEATELYEEASFVNDAPVGHEVGNRLGDFTIGCLDGGTFRLHDAYGKVVIINLWATYCEPCVGELPYFDELQREHTDDLEVVAVHANLTTEDVKAFVDASGWKLRFAIDDEDETVFELVNGSQALPQTIVLNCRGEVIYNRVGSVTSEVLTQLYEEARAV